MRAREVLTEAGFETLIMQDPRGVFIAVSDPEDRRQLEPDSPGAARTARGRQAGVRVCNGKPSTEAKRSSCAAIYTRVF